MDARQLRIGNWIASDNRPMKVSVICNPPVDRYKYISAQGEKIEGNFHFDDLDPIPLTPEILEQAGFEWDAQKKTHLSVQLPEQEINNRRITFYYSDGVCECIQLWMDDYWDGYFELKPCQYVHELQNLYFALTGTELPIKL